MHQHNNELHDDHPHAPPRLPRHPSVSSLPVDLDCTASFFALRKIDAGEELCISYIDENMKLADRTKQLKDCNQNKKTATTIAIHCSLFAVILFFFFVFTDCFTCNCPKCTTDREKAAAQKKKVKKKVVGKSS